MHSLRTDDAEIFYEVRGDGPAVILLHPFPSHHEFWLPVIPALESRYRLILARSAWAWRFRSSGRGPAFMAKHAADVARIMDACGIGKAAFIVCSIGGYIVFEFMRRFRSRVSALALCDTRPQPDTTEARANRLKNRRRRPRAGNRTIFAQLDSQIARCDHAFFASRSGGRRSAHDAQNVARRYQPRAARNGGASDSVPDLKYINVPTLIVMGEEDMLATGADGELMRQNIPGSRLKMIPKAGHYAPWEHPEAVAPLLRQFLDFVPLT